MDCFLVGRTPMMKKDPQTISHAQGRVKAMANNSKGEEPNAAGQSVAVGARQAGGRHTSSAFADMQKASAGKQAKSRALFLYFELDMFIAMLWKRKHKACLCKIKST